MFYAFLRYDGPDTRLISISETHIAESDSWREEDMKKKVVVVVVVDGGLRGRHWLRSASASSLTGDSPPF